MSTRGRKEGEEGPRGRFRAEAPNVRGVAFLLLVAFWIPLGVAPSVLLARSGRTTEHLILRISKVADGPSSASTSGPEVDVTLVNAGSHFVFINPDLLPEPWGKALNFPATVLSLEIIGKDGKRLHYVGDGSAATLDPVFSGFCHLLAVPAGGLFGQRINLFSGPFAYGPLVPGHYRVRARLFSRARSWLESGTKRAKQARGDATKEEVSWVFNGVLESAWIEVDIPQ